jgi:HAD superfamily hydrolase (TIGR01509 family)
VLPGLRAALDCLRDVPKCVASSSTPASLALKLEVVGLTADFAPHIFSTALVARGKPAPDIYLHAAAAMGCAPPDCIVVEDARHGVTGAKAAGMRVIGFTGASHATPALADELKAAGADSVVASMDALADTVRALLR